MSCYVCHPAIPGRLAAWLALVEGRGPRSAAADARTLATENVRAVRARYPRVTGPENWPGPQGYATTEAYLAACEREAEAQHAHLRHAGLAPAEVIGLLEPLGSYEYQVRAHPEFHGSAAADIVARLGKLAAARLPDRPRAFVSSVTSRLPAGALPAV